MRGSSTYVLLVVLMLGCRETPTEPPREAAAVANATVQVTMSPSRVVLRPGQETPVTLTVVRSDIPFSSFSFGVRPAGVVQTIATVRSAPTVTLYLRGVAPGYAQVTWAWGTFLYNSGGGVAGDVIVLEAEPEPKPAPKPSRRRSSRS